jgi:hypothetical protein
MKKVVKKIFTFSAVMACCFAFVTAVYAATWTIQKSFMPGNGNVVKNATTTGTYGTEYYGYVTGVRHVQGIGVVRISSRYEFLPFIWLSNGGQNVTVTSLDYAYRVDFGANVGTNVEMTWALQNDAYLLANLKIAY